MSQGYLAARYSRREELCGYRSALEERGHSVPARWLLGEHQVHGLEASRAVENDGPVPVDLAVKFAQDDVEDILAADWQINFTEKPRKVKTRGGRHCELGIFLGLKFAGGEWGNRKLYIVGPYEHVFHCLPDVDGVFDDFPSFLRALDAGQVTL